MIKHSNGPKPPTRETVPIADVAKRLGLNQATVYRYLKDGSIPSARFNGKYLVSESTVQKILKRD